MVQRKVKKLRKHKYKKISFTTDLGCDNCADNIQNLI